MLLLTSSLAMADFATPFVETTPVGGTSKEYGYLVSLGPTGTHFLVVVKNDQMEFLALHGFAEKGVVQDSMLGRRAVIQARVLKKEIDKSTNRVDVELKITRVWPDADPPNRGVEGKESGEEEQTLGKKIDVSSFTGITLVAAADMGSVDGYRSLGIRNGFGSGQPIADFIARGAYVSKHGNLIEKGDRFVIDSAEVVDSTDAFGNSGTKLILRSAAPKAGLAFYCYGFNAGRKTFWAIDTREFQAAVDGYFTMEEEQTTPPSKPVPIETPEIIRILEKEALKSVSTRHSQRIHITLKDGRKFTGLYEPERAGNYSENSKLSDILNLVSHIIDNRPHGEVKDVGIRCE